MTPAPHSAPGPRRVKRHKAASTPRELRINVVLGKPLAYTELQFQRRTEIFVESAFSNSVIALFKAVDRNLLAPHHGRLAPSSIMRKSDNSVITEFDTAAERELIAGLCALTPGASVIGEEGIETDPELFLKLGRETPVWVVDPIDGSGAFTRGDPTYGIMAALICNGETLQGYIYVPGRCRINGEDVGQSQEMAVVARKGEGTFLNGQEVNLASRETSLSKARVSFACRNQDRAFEDTLGYGLPGHLPRYTASFDYASLLRGDRDAVFFSEGRDAEGRGKCPPWDHAAGVLAINEAGGYAALPYCPEGFPYRAFGRYDRLLVAANRPLWREIHTHVHTLIPELCAPHPRPLA